MVVNPDTEAVELSLAGFSGTFDVYVFEGPNGMNSTSVFVNGANMTVDAEGRPSAFPLSTTTGSVTFPPLTYGFLTTRDAFPGC